MEFYNHLKLNPILRYITLILFLACTTKAGMCKNYYENFRYSLCLFYRVVVSSAPRSSMCTDTCRALVFKFARFSFNGVAYWLTIVSIGYRESVRRSFAHTASHIQFPLLIEWNANVNWFDERNFVSIGASRWEQKAAKRQKIIIIYHEY